MGDAHPGVGARRRYLADVCLVHRDVPEVRAGHVDLRSGGLGDGDQRQGQAAWRTGRAGRRDHRRSGAGYLEIGDRPGPDQEHSSERRTADPGDHGLRCQVRRSGLSRRSQLAAAGGRSGAEIEQRQHRGQYGVRERCSCAGHDRPGQAQQHPVRTRGRPPWTGRTDRSGHYRRQPGSARTEPAQ